MAEMLTAKQVAELFGLTEDTIWAWIRNGKIEVIKMPNGRYRINREYIERLLAPARNSTRRKGTSRDTKRLNSK